MKKLRHCQPILCDCCFQRRRQVWRTSEQQSHAPDVAAGSESGRSSHRNSWIALRRSSNDSSTWSALKGLSTFHVVLCTGSRPVLLTHPFIICQNFIPCRYVYMVWAHRYALQNGWTDRDAVWGLTFVSWRNHVLDRGPDTPRGRVNFVGLFAPLQSIRSFCCGVRKIDRTNRDAVWGWLMWV